LDGEYFQEFQWGRSRTAGRNVIGILEGSDEILRKEVVVVGAHYDHIGKGKPSPMRGRFPGKGDDDIYNGADDNASGSSGVLEIAQAFSMLPTAPKRSILFMFYDAEEKGLHGSRYYVGHPVFPLKDTVAMINLDMIGRGKGGRTILYGAHTGRGLDALVKACNEDIGLEYRLSPAMMGNSDHASFYQRGVPVLFFFTGIHPDYHRASDHADKIQHDPMEKITRLSFLILQELANTETRPEYTRVAGRRVLLGVVGRATGDGKGYRITGISRSRPNRPDRPALRAGLRVGDVLVRLGDTDTPDLGGLRNALGKIKPDRTVTAVIIRDGERMEIRVPFGPMGKRGWY
jgi:Zn-dependent M28 family amino/carboxypeptidase